MRKTTNKIFQSCLKALSNIPNVLAFFLGLAMGLLIVGCLSIKIDGHISLGEILVLVYTVILTVVVSKWWRDSQFKDDSLCQCANSILDEAKSVILEIHRESVLISDRKDSDKVLTELVPRFKLFFNLVYELDQLRAAQEKSKIGKEIFKKGLAAKKLLTNASPSKGLNESFDAGITQITLVRGAISIARVKIFE